LHPSNLQQEEQPMKPNELTEAALRENELMAKIERMRAALIHASPTIHQLIQEIESHDDYPRGLVSAAEHTARQCADALEQSVAVIADQREVK
jgi:hypothetical protein